ncbi:hypothetical protein ACFLX7_01420 [Chloroflexota bacterium]
MSCWTLDREEIPLRYSERKKDGLLQLEKVVPVQISKGSYDNNYEERYKACLVVYDPGERKYHRHPIDNIVGNKDQVEWVSELQFDWNRVDRVFLLPSEPLGCMPFDN